MITYFQNRMLKRLPQTALMYHATHQGDQHWRWSLNLTDFAAQLEAIRSAGLEASSVMDSGGKRSNANLLFTFDDGYANNEEALRLLLSKGFSATLFVVTDYIGRQSDWPGSNQSLPLLSLDQIKRLARQGIEIGVHGVQHEDMTRLPQAQLRQQLAGARTLLQDVTGQQVNGLAYPYGHYNEEVIRTAMECGFQYACSTEAGRLSASQSSYQLKRITIEQSDSLANFQRKLILGGNSPGKRALLGYMVKRLMGSKQAHTLSNRGPL